MMAAAGHDHQGPGGGDLLGQAVGQKPRFGVRPLKILEHDDQGQLPAHGTEQLSHRFDRDLLPLRWVEPQPGRIIDRITKNFLDRRLRVLALNSQGRKQLGHDVR